MKRLHIHPQKTALAAMIALAIAGGLLGLSLILVTG